MPRYDTCPNCGESKRTISKLCKVCSRKPQNRSADYKISDFPESWFLEFRGLFMGEGSAMIIRNNRSFAPCLSLGLRDDDAQIIEDIRGRLGGRVIYNPNVHRRNPKHGGQIKWLTTNLDHCLEICNRLLNGASISAKKLEDIERVRDFCLWRRDHVGHFYTNDDREEAERQMKALQDSRLYC